MEHEFKVDNLFNKMICEYYETDDPLVVKAQIYWLPAFSASQRRTKIDPMDPYGIMRRRHNNNYRAKYGLDLTERSGIKRCGINIDEYGYSYIEFNMQAMYNIRVYL